MCMPILDSTTNIKISYSETNNPIRDNLPNSVNQVCEYRSCSVRFPKPLNNIPNCLIKEFVHICEQTYVRSSTNK